MKKRCTEVKMAEGECGNCGTTEGTKKCSGCKSVSYCSVKCQTLHWKSKHKKECKKLRNKNKKKTKKKLNENENTNDDDNDDNKMKEKEIKKQEKLMWKCNICGFDNNLRSKICMVCDQLGLKISSENSRPSLSNTNK